MLKARDIILLYLLKRVVLFLLQSGASNAMLPIPFGLGVHQWRSLGWAQGARAPPPPLRWSEYAVNGSGQQAATA